MSKPRFQRLILKTVLMGDGAVGKTALRQRYLGRGFKSTYMTTVGADFAVKTIKIQYKGERTIEFQIWDLAGQPRFQAVRELYYKGCKAGLLCFDISRRETMENLEGWCGEAKKHNQDEVIPLIVVANKIDLRSTVPGTITQEEGLTFAEYLRESTDNSMIKYFETSAKTGENVDEVFRVLARMNLEHIEKTKGPLKNIGMNPEVETS
ncbi:MAG: Rab family GTPase [Promethearchaeota archaeon]